MSKFHASDLTITPAYSTINQLKPYPAGKPLEEFRREYGMDDVIKLASNENPIGCSPHVTLAITKELGELFRYPDANGHYLKQALADFHNLPMQYFTLGNGSQEIINLIGRCFVSHDDSVVFGQYSFIAYPLVTAGQGATAIEVPAKNYGIDLDAMLTQIQDNTDKVKVVFIANPNNPTGTMLAKQKVYDLLKQVPKHVLVVLDEAYVNYCPEADCQEYIHEFHNLIILRTFSKAYGLAGVRVGYAISHPSVSDVFNRVRQPFNVNRLAQSAALVALADQEFIGKVIQSNEEQKKWLYKQFDSLGINHVKSHTNFILCQIDHAQEINQQLLEQGVMVRLMAEYGLHDWIRVTVGLADENNRFIDTLRDLLT